jgi:hypothetical protein
MDEAPPVRRRGAFVPSLVTAVAILLWLTATAVVGALLDAAGSVAIGGDSAALLDPGRFGQSTLLSFAFAVSAAVSFWLIAPIVARLRPLAVVARSLVAGLVAAILMWPVEFFVLVDVFGRGPTTEQSAGLSDLVDLQPAYDAPQIAVLALSSELQLIVFRLPLYVLSGLALWMWLRRKGTMHAEA